MQVGKMRLHFKYLLIFIIVTKQESSALFIALSSKNPLDVLSVILPGRVFVMPFYVVSPTEINVKIWKEQDKKLCIDTKEKIYKNKLNKICASPSL